VDEQGGHVVTETPGTETAEAGADHVIVALQAQLSCYRRLARLAEAQRDQVQQGSGEQLMRLLRQRQDVLDESARLERVIGPARRQWATFVATLAADRRALAESLVLESRRLLEQITRSDADDMLVLQQRKLNVGRQINRAAASRQVHRAYASAAYAPRAHGSNENMDVSQ
jgi:hypothetical protein